LRAPHRRCQSHDGLDESEARGLGGEQDVAAERELECGGEAERVGGEHGGQGEVLDAVDEVEQAHPHLRGLLCGEPVEDMDVDAAAHDAAVGSDEKSARGLRDECVDGVGELVHERRVEQVERRAVDAEDGKGAVVLEADEAHGWVSVGWKETIGGEPTGAMAIVAISCLRLPGWGDRARNPCKRGIVGSVRSRPRLAGNISYANCRDGVRSDGWKAGALG
jgi:hypothetical protein